MSESEMSEPRGVFAAALTPLKHDLSPDTTRLVQHYRWLLDSGCDGLAPLGTTGEANSFSVEERIDLIEAMAAADLPKENLIIGTGCCAIPDTVRLTKCVLAAGFSRALMLPPFYYKAVRDDGLYAAYSEVIERVGDARLRLYIYHFPQMTGLQIGLDLIDQLLKAYPETIVGIKDSSGDWSNMEAMCRNFPGFNVFAGTERFLLAILRAGGAGCISATTNVTAAMAANVYDNWQREHADSSQQQLSKVRTVIEAYPAIPALKQLMARHSADRGWLNVRPPLAPLSASDADELFAQLDQVDFTLARAA